MTRYIIAYYNGTQIVRDYPTGSMAKAVKKEMELAAIYGRENVWIVNNLTELLVG